MPAMHTCCQLSPGPQGAHFQFTCRKPIRPAVLARTHVTMMTSISRPWRRTRAVWAVWAVWQQCSQNGVHNAGV